ncbi:beta strand repeat-containing protein [Sphingobium rhizovicinum]|uniref:Beta strand repeat-containing protein n=1 Tax=Sphingobium rhizovicinum TaxID=432308 RepID=A0ABV7NH00_9SPHN
MTFAYRHANKNLGRIFNAGATRCTLKGSTVTLVITNNVVTTADDDHAIDNGNQLIYVAATGLVAAQGDAAGIVSHTFLQLNVAGQIFGGRYGAWANGLNSATINVSGTGSIVGGSAAIFLTGTARIQNAGYIYGFDAIVSDTDLGSSTIINSGSIMASSVAISIVTSQFYSVTIQNSGLISGDAYAVITGDSADTVTNSGTIIGDLMLGSGNDRFNSRAGMIDGTVYGGDGDDILIGSAYDDVLNGGSGADRLDGGAGIDTATYSLSNSAGVTVDLMDMSVNTGFAAGDQLYSIENLTGSSAGDNIFGDNGANMLNGGGGGDFLVGRGGDDVLNGGTGGDTLIGGLGNDIYYVDNVLDVVVELDGEGADTIYSTVSYSLTTALVETMVLTGTAAVNATGNNRVNRLYGNDGNNILTGLGGNDTLHGGAGADTLIGGAGDDTYYVDDAGDQVIELDGQGNDRIYSTVTYSLAGTIVETLILTGFGGTGATGNGRANTLIGNDSFNSLSGLGGNDVLIGNGGNDTLDGGEGSDTLTGGQGGDSFRFSTTLGSGNVDRITDFSPVDDTIRLDDAIFTNFISGVAVEDGAFRVGASAIDADDRILYDSVTGTLLYDADGVGGVAAVAFARIDPGLALTSADFVIV